VQKKSSGFSPGTAGYEHWTVPAAASCDELPSSKPNWSVVGHDVYRQGVPEGAGAAGTARTAVAAAMQAKMNAEKCIVDDRGGLRGVTAYGLILRGRRICTWLRPRTRNKDHSIDRWRRAN
jgi:hypothetical protein